MNTPRILVTAAAAAALALAGAVTGASASELPSSAGIVRGTVSGHAYQNGGVSKEQVADMAHHMKRYDLRLTFSEGRHNAYAAGLRVHVFNAAGKEVLSLPDAGPLTDVSLPAGHYRVVAAFGGVRRSGSVDVSPQAPASLYLHWPRDET